MKRYIGTADVEFANVAYVDEVHSIAISSSRSGVSTMEDVISDLHELGSETPGHSIQLRREYPIKAWQDE